LERANLNHWTTAVILTTAIETSERRLRRMEITRKYAVKIVMKHTQSWKYDTNESENICHISSMIYEIVEKMKFVLTLMLL
jgi:hypothetical protein